MSPWRASVKRQLLSITPLGIAGFIGGNCDLAREIFKAKAQNDAGLGLLLALCVACLGLTADQRSSAWANRREAQLGLA